MLVLVIAALLAAVAVPGFEPLMARAKLYSATRDIASALRHARGQAMIRGRETEFELDLAKHTYRVTGRDKTYHLPPQIGLGLYTAEAETVDEDLGKIRFYPDGSATGGRVDLQGGGRKRAVDVSWLTGEVKIREEVEDDD